MDAAEISQSRDIGSVTVFSPVLDNGDVLSFHRKRGRIVDKDTGSEWDITGTALSGEWRGLRRLRVGTYRVIYAFDGRELLVSVVRVAPRREAYR